MFNGRMKTPPEVDKTPKFLDTILPLGSSKEATATQTECDTCKMRADSDHCQHQCTRVTGKTETQVPSF